MTKTAAPESLSTLFSFDSLNELERSVSDSDWVLMEFRRTLSGSACQFLIAMTDVPMSVRFQVSRNTEASPEDDDEMIIYEDGWISLVKGDDANEQVSPELAAVVIKRTAPLWIHLVPEGNTKPDHLPA